MYRFVPLALKPFALSIRKRKNRLHSSEVVVLCLKPLTVGQLACRLLSAARNGDMQQAEIWRLKLLKPVLN